MKKILVAVLCLMLTFSFCACSKDEPVQNDEQILVSSEQSNEATDAPVEDETNDASQDTTSAGEVTIGDVYSDGTLSYNVLGIRQNEANDFSYLIVKLEVFNNGSEDVNFSTFDRLTMYGGDTEFPVDLFANVDIDLSGNITPNNKIIGEVAFDITESTVDDYVLHIGSLFEYSPAIKISSADIGATFAQQFEASGVVSEYTIGVPVESDALVILLNSATVIASDKDGKEILLLDIDLTNKDAEMATFMLGLNFDGAYSADGAQLDSEVTKWTLSSNIDSGQTVNGIASFYIEEGIKDFYITVTPDLKDFSAKENIVFSVE